MYYSSDVIEKIPVSHLIKGLSYDNILAKSALENPQNLMIENPQISREEIREIVNNRGEYLQKYLKNYSRVKLNFKNPFFYSFINDSHNDFILHVAIYGSLTIFALMIILGFLRFLQIMAKKK